MIFFRLQKGWKNFTNEYENVKMWIPIFVSHDDNSKRNWFKPSYVVIDIQCVKMSFEKLPFECLDTWTTIWLRSCNIFLSWIHNCFCLKIPILKFDIPIFEYRIILFCFSRISRKIAFTIWICSIVRKKN